jgi:succinate-acetate transporter protein
MATTAIRERRIAATHQYNGAAPATAAKSIEWGNSAPLALAAFAVTTFMLSMINANFISAGVEPAVFGVALMFGGITQLLTGNTFTGVLFCGFGAFWLSLFAIAEFFLKEIPANQVGHALGLFLYAFGFFVISMTIASFRTNAIVVAALALLIGAFFALGAGNYGAHTGLVHLGGYLGLGAAALALYLSCAETCEATYGRSILPVWSLKR